MRACNSLKPVYICVLLALYAQSALANPLNPTVVNGQASFASTGNALIVTNTPGTIINWQGFSIGANEITRFNQQSAVSAVLNRVISNNPSSILGSLQSNGRVFLINPSGIVFGAGATVDVAGLVASTLSLGNADFLAGRGHLTQVPGAANISNAGSITAHGDGMTGGQIFLIAPNVENTGVITAANGEILLAAGHSVDLVSTSNPNLRVNITAPAGDATNVGRLIASSGSLGLFGTVVKNSGQVSADSATMQGGKIVFKASQRVDAGGMVSAQGAGGGEIKILADMQAGTVNVTGKLDASAPNSGNGGFIDTSAAHVQVANTASVTTHAGNGTSGTWLIDPTDFTIAATDPLNGSSYMSNATLATSLNSGNIIIQTLATGGGNGDILVNAAIEKTGIPVTTLTLQAHNSIIVAPEVPISSTGGALNVVFNADSDGLNGGAIVMNTSSSITSNGGNITLGGGVAGNSTGNAIGTALNHEGILLDGATLNAGAGNISLRGTGFAGTTFNDGVYVTNGSVIRTTGAGTITLNGTGGAGTADNYGVRLGTNAAMSSVDGAISINGQGGAGTSSWNVGVYVHNNAAITSTGMAGITLNGTGGNGTTDNYGVRLSSGMQISSANGDIYITGQGAGTGASNYGIIHTNTSGAITSTGSASITLDGRGAGSAGINTAGSIHGSPSTGNVTLIADTLGGTDSMSELPQLDYVTLIADTVGGTDSIVLSGTITQTAAGSIVSSNLSVIASGGINLTGTNQITNFNASNAVSGDVVLNNAAELTISSISNPAGNVSVTNTGNVTTSGNITASGAINLAATAGDFTQSSGSISNISEVPTAAGPNDVTLAGANITLHSVRSQRHAVLNATSNVNLLGLGSGSYIDDTYFVYNLPFTFNYFGTPYNQTYITTNGLVMFDSGTSTYSDSLTRLGDLRAIAPAWNDWMLNASLVKDIRIGFGTDDMKVRFDVVRYGNTSLNAQFETILNSNGVIKFNYGAANSSFAGDVTIGISNGAGTAIASQLMSRPNFSMNNLISTTFTPDANGAYTETLGTSSLPLSVQGPVSGSAILGQGTGQVVNALEGLIINAGGIINAPSQLSAQFLQFTSNGGASFTGTNYFAGITSAMNSGVGDIVIYNNAVPFTIATLANSGGNVVIDNTGGIVVNGALSSLGTFGMTAHSPITVNSEASIRAGGNLTLTAVSSGATSTTDLLSIAGAISSTNGSINLGGGSGISFAPTSSITATMGTVTATSPFGAITNQSATLTALDLALNSLANLNLTQGLTATHSISLNSSGAISNTADARLNAPSVQLVAGTGIGSAAAPLQLVTSNLNATTLTGGGYLFNTPNVPVTLVNLTSNDASTISYSQIGQDLNLTGVISSGGGSVLIDPPVNLTMSPTSSITSAGGTIGVLASGNIGLASINAGTGAVNVSTSGGGIYSVLPAGQNNITAGSVTASAVTGIQVSINAPVANITSSGGIILVNNLFNGATITNPPAPAPVAVPIPASAPTPAPVAAPAPASVAPQPEVTSLVNMSMPTINIPFNPPVQQTLTTDDINTLVPMAASSDNPDDQTERDSAAQEAAAAGTLPVTMAEAAAPLPVCQ